MKQTIMYILIVLLSINCGSKKKIEIDSSKPKPSSKGMFEQSTSFMVCSQYPNIFQLEIVDKKPLPLQGEHDWIRDFYMALKYPPASREKGLQGTVILELVIAPDGSIEDLSFIQQVAPDIDKAALDAFHLASKKGFNPAIFEGRSVKCKATVALHFRLR